MDEYLFGALSTDELRILYHRALQNGIQHSYEQSPRDPLPGDAVKVQVRTSQELATAQVACYYTVDGTTPAGSRGVAANGETIMLEQVETVWDTFVWGYISYWEGTLPAQEPGTTVRYQIGVWGNGSEEVFAGYPDAEEKISQATKAHFSGLALPRDDTYGDPSSADTYSYHVDTFSPPDWARNAVIYHVFVDRFYPGDGKEWLQTTDLRDYCGGTLWGVRDKMDYIADLGADCIWLSPTWVSDSHHGYDVIDYDRVEPRLGGDEALHAVVEAAHERGIRVLLDLVCNHISNESPVFVDARSNPDSPYRDWFIFDDSPVGYATYFGVAAMPKVNLADSGARQWMLDIARRWMREFDVDGYRLDHIIGVTTDFWTDFWVACKEARPDSFCFGEATVPPQDLRPYIGRMDGCLDFPVAEALRTAYGRARWTEADFQRFLSQHNAYFRDDFLLPTFLDNHDMDRFLFVAKGDKDALRRAAAAQMEMLAPPIIYYGTEVGLSQAVTTREGNGLHVNRTPMTWGDDQDGDLLAYYKSLIRKRRG